MGGIFSRPSGPPPKTMKDEDKKKRRDLYKEMMRKEHPNFASIPEDELQAEVHRVTHAAAAEAAAEEAGGEEGEYRLPHAGERDFGGAVPGAGTAGT